MSAAQYRALGKGKTAGPRKHKFNVSAKDKRTVDGIVFDSKLEKDFYLLLKHEYPQVKFCRQVSFLLQEGFVDSDGKKQRPVKYVADFLLGTSAPLPEVGPISSQITVVDAKGMKTDVYSIKKKMFMKRYGVMLRDVKSVGELRKLLKT